MRSKRKYETDPERVAQIARDMDAMLDASGCVADAFTDERSLRALAERLRVPYLAVQISRFGIVGLTEGDVGDYNAWRAALGGGEHQAKAPGKSKSKGA